jgi:hypothetical protein
MARDQSRRGLKLRGSLLAELTMCQERRHRNRGRGRFQPVVATRGLTAGWPLDQDVLLSVSPSVLDGCRREVRGEVAGVGRGVGLVGSGRGASLDGVGRCVSGAEPAAARGRHVATRRRCVPAGANGSIEDACRRGSRSPLAAAAPAGLRPGPGASEPSARRALLSATLENEAVATVENEATRDRLDG